MEVFFKEKSELKDVVLGFIKNLKIKFGIQVRYTCCNNARENVDFDKSCKQELMGIEFEYTASITLQQNCHVEQKLTNTATLLQNNLVTPNRD